MRRLSILAVLALAGCGGGHSAQPDTNAAPKTGGCRPPAHAHGFRGCGDARSISAIRRDDGALVTGPIAEHGGTPGGLWRKVILSPDHRTLLAQWSGQCEQQRTFFIPATGGGKPRVVTAERDWTKSPESEALGWRGPRALVRLPDRGETAASKPGLYLIDPDTFKRTLAAPARGRFSC